MEDDPDALIAARRAANPRRSDRPELGRAVTRRLLVATAAVVATATAVLVGVLALGG